MHQIAIDTFRRKNSAGLFNKYLFPDGTMEYRFKTDSIFYPNAIHILVSQIEIFS